MFIFLFLVLLSISNVTAISFNRFNRSAAATPTVSPPPAAPLVKEPTFDQLQVQLEGMVRGRPEMDIVLLRGATAFYHNIEQLLGQEKHSGDWRGYFSGGTGAATIKNISGRMQGLNGIIRTLSAKPSSDGDTEQELRYNQAASKYNSAANSLQITLQALGIDTQLPPAAIIDLTGALKSGETTPQTGLLPASTEPATHDSTTGTVTSITPVAARQSSLTAGSNQDPDAT